MVKTTGLHDEVLEAIRELKPTQVFILTRSQLTPNCFDLDVYPSFNEASAELMNVDIVQNLEFFGTKTFTFGVVKLSDY